MLHRSIIASAHCTAVTKLHSAAPHLGVVFHRKNYFCAHFLIDLVGTVSAANIHVPYLQFFSRKLRAVRFLRNFVTFDVAYDITIFFQNLLNFVRAGKWADQLFTLPSFEAISFKTPTASPSLNTFAGARLKSYRVFIFFWAVLIVSATLFLVFSRLQSYVCSPMLLRLITGFRLYDVAYSPAALHAAFYRYFY